jgi:phosphate transport system substrate-binding protein
MSKGRLRLIPSLAIAGAVLLLLAIVRQSGTVVSADEAITLQGSGATFPAPLYERWFAEYNKTHPSVQINYQAIGSGAGIKQFQQHLVDFGASDAAMTDEQIAAVSEGVQLLPMTAGIVVLAYSLPDGPAELKLSRAALVDIFLGKVTSWKDPEIAKANPGANMPDTKITVVTRSDGSGTTFAFTSHLSATSDAWKNGPGAGTTVNFPVGVSGKGNPGVAALIKQTPGAIGYVEYAYAKQTAMPMATLENKSGSFVKPELQAGQSALASVKLPANLRAFVTDPPGANAYPIVTYTWMLLYKKYKNPQTAQTLKQVILFGLGQGQSYSTELGYIPLPDSVISDDKSALESIS